MPCIAIALPWKGHPSPLPTFCTFADVLELDRDSVPQKYSLDGLVNKNFVLDLEILESQEQLGQLGHAHLCESDVRHSLSF